MKGTIRMVQKNDKKKKMRPIVKRERARFLEGIKQIDTNNIELLSKFLTEHGRIIPARLTGISAKEQRKVRRAICRARIMGLLP